MYDFNERKINWNYSIQIFIRQWLLFYSYWAALSSIHYANLAHINFGIISCCFIVSVVVNTAAGRFFFKETLTFKVGMGIVITMSGIIWISLA